MKKAKMLVALLVALLMVFTLVLTACEKHTCEFSTEWTSNDTYHWHKSICEEHPNATADQAAHTWDGDVCSVCKRDRSLNDYRLYITADLTTARTAIGSVNTTIDAAVKAAYDAGVEAIEQANSVSAIQEAFKAAKSAMANCVPYANGIFDYTGLSTAEKTAILGLLENYAIRTGMTGITLFEDGGYAMYNTRVTLGTNNYIPGYGFGTLAEGSLNAPLAKESNEAWKMYWHGINASNPGTANYLNDKGSEVSDFYSYIAGAYYTTFMNSTKDGYDWVPELAVADPEPVGSLNAAGQATTWRFEVRQDLRYNTLGKRADKYNGRAVALEDFETAFKLLLNGKNGLARGDEMTTATGAARIPGAKEYWNLTKNGNVGINNTVDFEKTVGIKVYKENEGQENEKWWFEYTLGAPVNAFYARYYIDSSLYMPVPEEFINDCGWSKDGDLYYLGFNGTKTYSPVDNSLSLGAYTLESWDNQNIVYKKNPFYVHAESKYKIEGVHIHIYEAAQTSPTASFEYFLDGNTDSAGIPYTLLDQYKSDPRTRSTTGSSCFKLNMNALDAATWEKLFGVNGTVTQTPSGEYWDVEPAMSNAHFRSALSYALDRVSFADSRGCIASVDFLSTNYMSDPENGIAYDSTQAHKNAIAGLVNGTDGYGFSLELAREYFRIALRELEASGAYKPGTKENPTVINLEIAWMYPTHEAAYHDVVKQYWEDAFNDESVTGGLYRLNVEFWVGTQWSDVYYNKMMVGQFDLGFGSISGNTLDPLSFMEVLSADQAISGNFTLNWGVDTNSADADILVYNGMRWSYDALLESTQQPTQVLNGSLQSLVSRGDGRFEFLPDSGNIKATLSYEQLSAAQIEDSDFYIYGYVINEAGTALEYAAWSIKSLMGNPTSKDGVTTYTFEIPASEIAKFYFVAGIDLYLSYSVPSEGIPATPMDPQNEIGIIGGWELGLAAAADHGTYSVNEDGDVVAKVTAALLLDGLTTDQLLFYMGGYYEADNARGYAYGEVDLLDYLAEDGIKKNANGTYTFTFVIDAEEFDGLLNLATPTIDLYVMLGSGASLTAAYTTEGWDVVLASAGRSSFKVDEENETVTATLIVAIANGLKTSDLGFVFYGYYEADEAPYYTYDEVDVTSGVKSAVKNENGTYTVTIEIALEHFSGLLEQPGIDLYVRLGDGSNVAFVDGWDVTLAQFGSASVTTDEENGTVVTLTILLAEGLTVDDNVLFAISGYTDELEPVNVVITDVQFKVNEKTGVITITFTVPADLQGLSGEFVITGEDEGVDLAAEQALDFYIVLSDGTMIAIDSWAHVFVPAK